MKLTKKKSITCGDFFDYAHYSLVEKCGCIYEGSRAMKAGESRKVWITHPKTKSTTFIDENDLSIESIMEFLND